MSTKFRLMVHKWQLMYFPFMTYTQHNDKPNDVSPSELKTRNQQFFRRKKKGECMWQCRDK
jgi:hypothetical protein